MSQQIEKTAVEQEEEGTESTEQVDPELQGEEEEEDSDAIFVEVEEADPEQPVVKDVFDLQTFEPLLKEGEEYYNDFGEVDREKNPELFMTDEEVDKIFKNMTESEKKQFLALKDFHLKDYLKQGRITPLSELIQAIMKENKPNIPSSSKEQQEALRNRLLQEARKMSELRERGMAPEIKPPKRIRTEYKGPAFSEEKDETGKITITLLPGRDPYEDLAKEDEEVIDMTGAETDTDVDPDMESADDISVVSMDSLAEIDKEKVKKIWKEMSEVKTKEAVLYNNLSEMVEEMSPVIIQETVKMTPKPGSTIPQEVESLNEEIGSAAVFKKVVAAGYMMYELYLKSKDPKYKPLSYRQAAKKFNVGIKGLKEIRRGAAYERDRTRLQRMVKKEELDVKPEVPPQEKEEDESEEEQSEQEGQAEQLEQPKGVKRKYTEAE